MLTIHFESVASVLALAITLEGLTIPASIIPRAIACAIFPPPINPTLYLMSTIAGRQFWVAILHQMEQENDTIEYACFALTVRARRLVRTTTTTTIYNNLILTEAQERPGVMADVQESNISESNLFGLPPTKKARAGNVEENMTLDIAEEIPAIVPFSDKNRMQPMCAEQSGTELFSTTKSAGLKYDKGPNTDEVEREGAEREHLVFSEKDFGIEEYISSQKGINGIIKQRYSDFMVREIDQSGRIITLNSITQLPEEAPNPDLKIPCKNEEIECPVSKDDKARIETLSAKFEIEKASQSDFILLSVDNDKEHRKLVHLFVKENYKNLGS